VKDKKKLQSSDTTTQDDFFESLKWKISTNSLNMQGLATWQDFEQGYP
jgi:hypothetical protein